MGNFFYKFPNKTIHPISHSSNLIISSSSVQLHDIEWQLCMHGLDRKELLSLGKSCKKLLSLVDSPFAWKFIKPFSLQISKCDSDKYVCKYNFIGNSLIRHCQINISEMNSYRYFLGIPLKSLIISDSVTDISNSCLNFLSSIPRINSIYMNNLNLCDPKVIDLFGSSSCSKLMSLHLNHCCTFDLSTMETLSSLRNLQSLELSVFVFRNLNQKNKEKCINLFSHFPALTDLTWNDAPSLDVDISSLRILAECEHIQMLSLISCNMFVL
jgi:hypothetical protein